MAKSKKKSAKEASNTSHNIMKASVSSSKPIQQFPELGLMGIQIVEKFGRNGKDYVIIVTNNGDTYDGEIYKIEKVVKGKKGQSVSEIVISCKQAINSI